MGCIITSDHYFITLHVEEPLKILGCKVQAHADFIYEKINDYGWNVDIEVEAKAKEVAVLKYKDETDSLLESYQPFDNSIGNGPNLIK